MCGICGIVSRDRTLPISNSRLQAMRDAMSHRGPDDAGCLVAPGIGLGSRRLSIVDLSERGHMPMRSTDGRYWIAYNGEVYNYRELRSELQSRGYVFRSRTDTEVILYAYAADGPAMLERLNGMFAFAIWDTRERELFIGRDRLGVKPLYYATAGDEFYFASEEKGLFASGVAREFDPDTWEELLCFRYVAGERTPYVGVKRLLPGHYLTWRDGKIRTRRWWNLAERVETIRENLPADPFDWFRDTFDSAVGLRRISDVPVGVLLSGGLDSSSVAASLASQAGKGVASFTVRFAERAYDEGPLAQQVAEQWRLEPHELQLSPDRLMPLIKEASRLNDEPLVHGNDLYLLAISRYAKPRVTVLLSGEGADETLGGYVRYRPLRYPALLKAARPILPAATALLNVNGRIRKLGRFLSLGQLSRFVLFNACDVLPQDLPGIGMNPTGRFEFREQILNEAQGLFPSDLLRQAMYSDLHTFLCSILDRNDRMTMGASIECRVPFLDYRLVETLAALPSSVLLGGRQNKHVLRQSVGKRLPEAVLRHPKWGFAVPWGNYMRRDPELREVVERLPDLEPIGAGAFNRLQLKRTVSEFLEGNNHHDALVRQLFMIAVWHQSCFRGSAKATTTFQR